MSEQEFDSMFFVFDSDGIESLQSALYGYVIRDSVIEDADALEAAPVGENGAYVYIEAKDDRIGVYQDFAGSFGLFLFRQDGYFAISNNFQLLAEYLSSRGYRLTENDDYNCHFFLVSLCSMSCEETPAKEIALLPRDTVVRIDKKSGDLEIRQIDFGELSIPIASMEALEVLDEWFERWTTLIAGTARLNEYMYQDLSGGMDSRVLLALLLNSGADMRAIRVESSELEIHTYAEDYAIAKQLADRHGFALNVDPCSEKKQRPRSLDDVYFNTLYTKLGFHKQMYWVPMHARAHHFTGHGGEALRGYYAGTPEEFKAKQLGWCRWISLQDNARFSTALENTIDRSLEYVRKKYATCGRPIDERDVVNKLCRETEMRFHCGRTCIERYAGGEISYLPLLDKSLAKIASSAEVCPDYNLLYALIFVRYAPTLLSIAFEGNRKIDHSTVQCAKGINALKRYPGTSRRENIWGRVARGLTSRRNGEAKVHGGALADGALDAIAGLDERLDAVYQSEDARLKLSAVYSPTILQWVDRDVAQRRFHPEEAKMSMMSALRISYLANSGEAQDLVSWVASIEKSPQTRTATLLSTFPFLRLLATARVDLTLSSEEEEGLTVVAEEGVFVNYEKPSWLCGGGCSWLCAGVF